MRASASTPASPIRLSASRKQPIFHHDRPNVRCAHWPPPKAIRHHQVRTQHHAPRATRIAPHMRRPRATAQKPRPARTIEPKLGQTRRQCARQRLNARSTDLVVCKPQAAEPHPRPTQRTMRALPSPKPKAIRHHKGPKPSTTHHMRPALHHMPRPRAAAQKRRSHVPLRPSIVKPGGNARASASTPASPIRFPAEPQASDPRPRSSAQCARNVALKSDAPPQGPKPRTTHYTRPPNAAHPQRPRAAAQKPQTARTAEIKRRQPRRQCARQRLHSRSSDLVPCKAACSRSSTTTDPAHNARTGPHPPRRSAITRSEPSTTHHMRPTPHHTCPDRE